MRSQRQLRVGEEIRHMLASIFMRGDVTWPYGFPDPMVTVTEVQVSPDLKNASVFITTLGGKEIAATVKILNAIVGHFRHEVAQQINLRYVPKLRFNADNSFAYAEHINKILHDPSVARDLRSNAGEGDDNDDDKDTEA